MKPTIEEALSDLTDLRKELAAMRTIQDYCMLLSNRADVDAEYYRSVERKVCSDIAKGAAVEEAILKRYPQLH